MLYRRCLCILVFVCCLFFFKRVTAFELRMSDWSSDVFSSDLAYRCAVCAGRSIEIAFSQAHLMRCGLWHRRRCIGVAGEVDAGVFAEFVETVVGLDRSEERGVGKE